MAFKILAAQRMASYQIEAKNSEEAGKVMNALSAVLGEPKATKEKKDGMQAVRWQGKGFRAWLTLAPGDSLHYLIEVPRSKAAQERYQRFLENKRKMSQAYRPSRPNSGRGSSGPQDDVFEGTLKTAAALIKDIREEARNALVTRRGHPVLNGLAKIKV